MKGPILIVDDDPEVLQLLYFTLETAGFETVLARNAEEFRRQAVTVKPSVIVLDIMLGEENGPEIYDNLIHHGLDPEVPVIFLSALAEDRPPSDLQKGHRYALIGKPFDPQLLVEKISSLASIV